MITDQSALVRELSNGTMFVSAVCIIIIFLYYIWSRFRDDKNFYKDIAVMAAASIIVMVIGHALRAGSSWMEFLWLRKGWGEGIWINTIETFIIAATLIVTGKLLILWEFAKPAWKLAVVGVAAILSISIPWIVWLIV